MAKAKEVTWKLKCNLKDKEDTCIISSVRYFKMCKAHQKEHDEIRARWHADHANPAKYSEANSTYHGTRTETMTSTKPE